MKRTDGEQHWRRVRSLEQIPTRKIPRGPPREKKLPVAPTGLVNPGRHPPHASRA